jgi:hypothetical protein
MPNQNTQKTQKSQKKQASAPKEDNGPNPEEYNKSSPPQKQNQKRQPPVGRIVADIFKSIAIEETQVSHFFIVELTFVK